MYLKTIKYNDIKSDDFDKLVEKAPKDIQEKISTVRETSPQRALKNMALFPLIMLIAYIGIYFYFQSKGGYKPIELEDGDSSGG